MPTALGIDIGGTHVRAAIVDQTGSFDQLEIRDATPHEGDPARLAESLKKLVGAGRNWSVVGVVVPGVWDRETGVMQRAVNLPRLEGRNLREFFENILQRPVWLETDVIAAGWAQRRRLLKSMPDARCERFVYLSLGTGVGGAVILNNEILRHTRGGAGQLGHLIVDASPDAPVCKCGARGCLEAVLGGKVWERGEITPERAARALAVGLLQIAHLYAPDLIALGGGVIDHQIELSGLTLAAFREIRGSLVPPHLQIECGLFNSDQAGVIGAALLALEQENSGGHP